MKRKKLFFTLLTMCTLNTIPAMAATTIYCPTSFTCNYNYNCTTSEDNGYGNWAAVEYMNDPGIYGLVYVETNPGSGTISCWYTNSNSSNGNPNLLVSSSNTYAPVGPNWQDPPEVIQICPSSAWGKEFVIPQACGFIATSNGKNKFFSN